jgi:hypothetical protein
LLGKIEHSKISETSELTEKTTDKTKITIIIKLLIGCDIMYLVEKNSNCSPFNSYQHLLVLT